MTASPIAPSDTVLSAQGLVKLFGGITATGMHELAKIQKFLALRDDQVEKTKFQVTRLRVMTEIRKGHLPVVAPNAAS